MLQVFPPSDDSVCRVQPLFTALWLFTMVGSRFDHVFPPSVERINHSPSSAFRSASSRSLRGRPSLCGEFPEFSSFFEVGFVGQRRKGGGDQSSFRGLQKSGIKVIDRAVEKDAGISPGLAGVGRKSWRGLGQKDRRGPVCHPTRTTRASRF